MMIVRQLYDDNAEVLQRGDAGVIEGNLTREHCDGQTKLVVNNYVHQLPTKYSLYKTLVISILLYGYQTQTLHADTLCRLQTFVSRRLLRIS
ncbi:hypothetical protein DPMN_162668 [Dreissena polymorpha]|uniref:Uncharacterized protein n=1 Tax=Dreissena polymorpha TaxID=45954 RepID=A0A9D4EQ02_DREPO|nr:hypothetical protein DPMN_162668 [Dreissena polymorpha]